MSRTVGRTPESGRRHGNAVLDTYLGPAAKNLVVSIQTEKRSAAEDFFGNAIIWLLERVAAALILLARTGIPKEESWEEVRHQRDLRHQQTYEQRGTSIKPHCHLYDPTRESLFQVTTELENPS